MYHTWTYEKGFIICFNWFYFIAATKSEIQKGFFLYWSSYTCNDITVDVFSHQALRIEARHNETQGSTWVLSLFSYTNSLKSSILIVNEAVKAREKCIANYYMLLKYY